MRNKALNTATLGILVFIASMFLASTRLEAHDYVVLSVPHMEKENGDEYTFPPFLLGVFHSLEECKESAARWVQFYQSEWETSEGASDDVRWVWVACYEDNSPVEIINWHNPDKVLSQCNESSSCSPNAECLKNRVINANRKGDSKNSFAFAGRDCK